MKTPFNKPFIAGRELDYIAQAVKEGNMVALGIIGEYLGRLHMNVGRKPQYSVREVLGRGEEADAQDAD